MRSTRPLRPPTIDGRHAAFQVSRGTKSFRLQLPLEFCNPGRRCLAGGERRRPSRSWPSESLAAECFPGGVIDSADTGSGIPLEGLCFLGVVALTDRPHSEYVAFHHRQALVYRGDLGAECLDHAAAVRKSLQIP